MTRETIETLAVYRKRFRQGPKSRQLRSILDGLGLSKLQIRQFVANVTRHPEVWSQMMRRTPRARTRARRSIASQLRKAAARLRADPELSQLTMIRIAPTPVQISGTNVVDSSTGEPYPTLADLLEVGALDVETRVLIDEPRKQLRLPRVCFLWAYVQLRGYVAPRRTRDLAKTASLAVEVLLDRRISADSMRQLIPSEMRRKYNRDG